MHIIQSLRRSDINTTFFIFSSMPYYNVWSSTFFPMPFALSTVKLPISQNLIHAAQKCRETQANQRKKGFPENDYYYYHYYDSFGLTWRILWITIIVCVCASFGLPSSSSWVESSRVEIFVGPFVHFPNVSHFTDFSHQAQFQSAIGFSDTKVWLRYCHSWF